ncbi:MAG: hypothetical protein HY247_02425 [archaeon]|nr:MAG: hypothetical protein HY247_02425 [archaeon]
MFYGGLGFLILIVIVFYYFLSSGGTYVTIGELFLVWVFAYLVLSLLGPRLRRWSREGGAARQGSVEPPKAQITSDRPE